MKKVILIILLGFGFTSADIKKEFFPNGSLKYISISTTGKNSTQVVRSYYANGSLKKELLHNTNTTGCKLKVYRMNGHLKQEFSFTTNKDCTLE